MEVSRLDNTINKSDKFFEDNHAAIMVARANAKRNNEWANSHRVVNQDTGEVIADKEGKILSLGDMSKSWYGEKGGRNNAFSIVRRLQKAHSFDCDIQKFRPKFITLTFAGINQSWHEERAIQKFLDTLRHWAKRQGVKQIAYFWTSEVQERGALHYHLLLLGAPYLAKEQVASWWSHGFVDIRAVDDMGRAFKYLAKYLWKWGHLAGEPDKLPDWWYLFSVYSKRRYGFSKWFQLPIRERIPSWLRLDMTEMDMLHQCVKASRAVGGGWRLEFEDVEHNEQFALDIPSPYRIVKGGA